MSKEAEDGGNAGKAKGDNVEDEDISEPFDNDIGYLEGCVADEGVYILVGG